MTRTARALLTLLPALSLALATPSRAVTSGAYTTDVKLAVKDFVKNATEAAKDAGLLDKGIPCTTNKQTPQQLAANAMRRAVNEMRMAQAGEIFGNATLDAINKVAGMHPATKGIGEAAGLLKTYLGSKDLSDFAGKVFKDKVKGKVTGKVKDAIGEDAWKGAEALYKVIEKQLQEQAAKAFSGVRTVSSACGGADAKFTVKVDMKARRIEITLTGDCDCSKGGVKSYAGLILGRVQIKQGKKGFEWRFVVTGMSFTGECCNGSTGRPRHWGAVPMPDGKAVKMGDDYEGGRGCDTVDCDKLHDEFRKQHKRLQGVNDSLKQLPKDDPARGNLDAQRYAAISSIQQICKDLNDFGHSRASYLAEALVYAADQGAQVINLSVGGKNLTRAEKLAIDYAHAKGAVVVVAAGNEGSDVAGWSPAGLEHVIAVGATDSKDAHAVFSNWGAGIDLVAPGTDVLSLRARRTDLMQDIPGVRYTAGEGFVGADRRYYRASGTSFSAPIVAGVASLLLSKDPALRPEEVERILVHSARDVATPGVDQYTGYGLVDASAALRADPAYFLEARITGAAAAQVGGATVVQLTGTADADQFARAWIEIGAGKDPTEWTRIEGELPAPVRDGVIGQVPAEAFGGAPQWTLRVRVEHSDGTFREARFVLTLG